MAMENAVPTRAEIEAFLATVEVKPKEKGLEAVKARNASRKDKVKGELQKKFKDEKMFKKVWALIEDDLSSYQNWEQEKLRVAREV